jgi:hypothetical protein
MGVYIINRTVTDEFGFAKNNESSLKVIAYKGINESFGSAKTEVDSEVDW